MKIKLFNASKKRLVIAAFLLLVCAIAAVLYFHSVSDTRVDPSGVVFKDDTPENTVKTYYELIYNNRYEPAAGLQTEESQKILTAADIEARYKQVKMTSARLAKVFDAVIQGHLAVVGDVRLVRFAGNSFDSAIVGVTVLTKKHDNTGWKIVNSLQEVGEVHYLTFLEMLVKVDQLMKKTDLTREGFTDSQARMISKQIDGMLKFHKEQLEEYRNYLHKEKQKQKPANNGEKKNGR